MHNTSNLTKTSGSIYKEQREALLKQKAVTYWITGLSGSGKTTLAYGLEETLFNQGKLCYVLDGDNIRYGLIKIWVFRLKTDLKIFAVSPKLAG